MSSHHHLIMLRFPSGATKHQLTIAALLTHGRMRAARLAHLLECWRRRRRSRNELSALSNREILDFCHSLTDAHEEIKKPFWRA